MALEKYTLVSYTGTDLGRIYLEDIGKRKQLGGGDQFARGQDIMIDHGDTIALVNSGNVLSSVELGIIKTFSTDNSEKIAAMWASKGTSNVITRNSGYTGTQLPRNGGITGLHAPFVLIPSAGATGVVRAGVTGGKAHPATTIGEF